MAELGVVDVVRRVIACVEVVSYRLSVTVEPILCRSPRLADPAEDAGIAQLVVTQCHT